jgi:hypothetical protein
VSTLPNHRPLWTMAGWSALVAGVVLFGLHADRYSAALATRVLVVGLLAASVAVLAGWCGLASLGQTFPFALGAFTTGLLAKQGLTTGPLLVCLAAGAEHPGAGGHRPDRAACARNRVPHGHPGAGRTGGRDGDPLVHGDGRQ